MKTSASRSAAVLDLGYLYLALLLELEGKVKGKGAAEAGGQGERQKRLSEIAKSISRGKHGAKGITCPQNKKGPPSGSHGVQNATSMNILV